MQSATSPKIAEDGVPDTIPYSMAIMTCWQKNRHS